MGGIGTRSVSGTLAVLALLLASPPAYVQEPEQAPQSDNLEFPDSLPSSPSTGAEHGVMGSDQPAAPPENEAAGRDSEASDLDVIPLPRQAPAASEPKERRSVTQIEEIIVTAQRREENLQDVPISVTVLDQKKLADANITNASDLATYTPSLSAAPRFGAETATFGIRGFSQELRTTASVATYFAEVVAPRGQTIQTSGDGAGPGSLFDLENVQVLKGPQGTLFGRNSTGGAVLLVPRRPSDEYEGYVELSIGDFGALREQAVINIPASSDFRFRMSVDRNERDGYLRNVVNIGTEELGNTDYLAARISAVWNVTDSIENYTIVSYVDSLTKGYTSQLYACNSNLLNPLRNLAGLFAGTSCQAQLDRQAAAGENGFYDVVSSVATPLSEIKEKRLINTTTWTIADDLTLKNIVAYGHLHTDNGSDIFGVQLRAIYDPDPNRQFNVGASVISPETPVTSQKTWVEEVQIQATALDERLEWQAGAYYEHSMPDGPTGNNAAALISCNMASLELHPSEFDCFDPLGGLLGAANHGFYETEYLNQALYAQGTFDFTSRFSVTAGARYTWDRTSGNARVIRYPFLLAVPLPPTEVRATPVVTSDAPTWVLNFSFMPTDEVMTYAKYTRGYRQGGIVLLAEPGIDTYEAEQVDTYELGAKLTFTGDIQGRLNFAAFYNDFTNQQLQTGYVSRSYGTTTAIFNAGKSRIAGAEVEAFVLLPFDLSLSLSYSHLATKLISLEDTGAAVAAAAGPIAGATSTPIAEVGDSLPFAPDHTYVATLSYPLPLDDSWGRLELSTTFVYNGEQRAAASTSSPFAVLDDRKLLNLNLNWRTIVGSPLDLSVFATNVLDEEYVAFTSGTYNVLGLESRQPGIPRMIGARMRYNFGP